MVTPRVRNRKPRTTRMDAAIDSMKQFGFASTLVRKRVNQLLSVYGGEDSWTFIEENAYKVLLESFLDEQDEAMSLACVEDKKVDTVGEDEELVPCSLGGEENATDNITPQQFIGVVPLRKSYGWPRCEGDDDDSDEDGNELIYFEPATKESDILFPKMGVGSRRTILIEERRTHTRTRPVQENDIIGGSSSKISQRENPQIDKGKGPFQSSNGKGNGSEMGRPGKGRFQSSNDNGTEMRRPGMGPFQSSNGNGSEMRRPGKGPFQSSNGNRSEMRRPGMGPFQSSNGNRSEMRRPGMGPFQSSNSNGSEMRRPGNGPFQSSNDNGSEMRRPGKGSFQSSHGNGSEMGRLGKGPFQSSNGNGSQMGRPVQEEGITSGSISISSQRGNPHFDKGKRPFQSSNSNGCEMGRSSAFSSRNNNHGNIRPKRQLVQLERDPYASHK